MVKFIPSPRTLMIQNETCGIAFAAKADTVKLFKDAEVADG